MSSKTSFPRHFADMGIDDVHYLPPRRTDDLPPVGEGTQFLLAQPFLNETARALIGRGARHLEAPYPLGAEGTFEWFRSAATAQDVPETAFAAAMDAPMARAKRSLERYRARLDGKRISFLPDSQLEIPIARFLNRECGMDLVEVGVPYLDQTFMARELDLLPHSVRLSEGQNVDKQLDRVRRDRPDLTVCGLGLANPLEAEGLRSKWAIELVFSPIHGFDQAGDLAELFCRPLIRQEKLAV